MDFTLSEEQILLKNTVRDFMKSKNVHGWIEDAEKNKEFPRPFMREAALLGLLGMNVGEEYGGAGLSYLDAVIVIEEMAYWSISFSLCVLVQNSLGTFPLSVFGSSYQKSLILPVLCSGEKFICFANTEPGVGSDAKNISTSAKKIDEYNWSLNGVKRFITNASVSDWATVSARTSIRKPGHPGITTYLINIEPGINGYEFLKKEDKDIQPGSELCEFKLDDYRVFNNNILGEFDQGWKVVDRTFCHSRIWIAAQAIGAAQRALDDTIKHTANTSTFGHAIINNQAIGHKLAQLQTEIEAARLLTYKAVCQEMENNPEFVFTASMAKCLAPEIAKKAADVSYQFHGGLSASKDSISYRLNRDIPIISVYEGATEIQREIICKAIERKAKSIEI